MEGEDVYDYEIKMEVQPQNFSYTAYDAKQGTDYLLDSKTQSIQSSNNPFQQFAYNASKNLYNVSPMAHYDQSLLLNGSLDMQRSLERDMKKRQNLVYVEATSNNPCLRVGDVVKMMAWIPGHEIFKNGRVPIESYKITEIVHTFADGEGYTNTFVGVPKDLPVPPYYNEVEAPKAQIQHATVKDNRDPLKMGRVRVQFTWQRRANSQTPWVQVIQPHSGGGKGTYFNPEIGETVLCAFQGGNAEAPIVLGTAYNGGEIAEYYTQGNDIKVIQTRSGTKIVFNDAQEQGSILIEDPSGNKMFMDGQGNIKTYAPKDMEITTGENLNIHVGNNLHFTVGNQATLDIMQKMLVNTPFMQQLVSNYYHTQAGKALINSENQIKIESPETFVQGGQRLMLHSDELATLNSRGIAELKGETKNSLSNKATSYITHTPETKADCIIHFRPGKNYQKSPDFGFDYIRIGDTGYKGDVWYKDIIGRYKDSSGNLKQIYSNGVFTKDEKEYSKIVSTFEQIILKKRKDAQNSNYIYYVPKMTLKKGNEANLILKIKIEKEPEKLKFVYDKSCFGLEGFTNDQIAEKSKGNRTLNLKVKCKKVFSTDQSISIMADGEICGKLLVKANNYSYNIKVVFVEVKTNIKQDSKGSLDVKEQNKLKNILSQAYIDVNIKYEELDLTGFFTSKWFWLNYSKNGQINTAGLHKYLNDKMTNKYKEYYKIYIFGENSGGLNGVAEGVGGAKSAIVFPGRTGDASMATSSHELLHSIGLYHTFDNNSKFTFERGKIDNVMDYSHWSGIPRCSTTHWQWQLLQQKLSNYKTLVK
ncbi:hypothetical protein C4S77_06765 [Apibacter adventoris]|uniref:Gp5/Type VI secretion system Vgr protein OB-fold domain-containing protein n=2 Tax=Apibacter adventoris TaxID=1679466 RepID=A0A2S8ABG7_9FLAO|nr:hypothetical protein C4S77_06765 [Apibacter adventoris]